MLNWENVNLSSVKKNVNGLSAFLSTPQKSWWDNLFENPEQVLEYNTALDWSVGDLGTAQQMPAKEVSPGNEDSPLFAIMQKERNVTKVRKSIQIQRIYLVF